MAFSTIQGSGGAPDSFVGTAGVDNLLVTTLGDASFIGAEAAGDTIQFNTVTGVVTGSTVRGGQGNDTVVNFGTSFGLGEVNGNAGADVLTFNIVNSATLRGGQGTDTIEITNNLVNSLVNGNKDGDTITTDDASISIQNSSIYGGAANDTINIVTEGTDLISDSKINGNNGNDTITIFATGADILNTTINGGDGNDTIDGGGSTVSLIISGDKGEDEIQGGFASDTIFGGDDDDEIYGGGGNDTLTGDGGINDFVYGAGADGEAETFSGQLSAGTIDVITDFDAVNSFIGGFALAGTQEFGTTVFDSNFSSYGAALTGANEVFAAENFDFVLSAYGSGTSWTAVLFIDVDNDGSGAGVAAGAIQIGQSGVFRTEAAALDALDGGNIFAVGV